MATRRQLKKVAGRIKDYALGLPEAWEDHPWGETVAKVKKKVFVFMMSPEDVDDHWSFSVKLPESNHAALDLPFTQPTGYGLGKSGWVSAKLTTDDDVPPVEIFEDWVRESYCAIAPKTLARAVTGDGADPKPARKKRTRKKRKR